MLNGTLIQFFHWYSIPGGVFWDHFKEQSPYLAKLGINAAWLPPAFKATGGGYSVGYDVYDLYHLGGGDEKELIQVVKVDPEDRNKPVSEPFDIEAYTKFTYPGRQGKYSQF